MQIPYLHTLLDNGEVVKQMNKILCNRKQQLIHVLIVLLILLSETKCWLHLSHT